MTVDKRISYEMQGGKKPARNYLGKQKTVSNVPIKWKSGPDHPETELAYITKAEKDLLVKKDLHGSLKNGPNTGPDGIMSLNDQGDYTRDRSSAGRAPGTSSQHSDYMNQQIQAAHDKHMKDILTGQKNIGQTVKTGPKTRKYAVPEYVKVKQKDGTYKNKYVGSGYKSYGTPSFFGNLFSRGAPGYRGIKGMPAFGNTYKNLQWDADKGYYSDYENFGETRGAMPLGILGLLANIFKPKKKTKDMSKYNKLQLVDGELVDDPTIDKIPVPGESAWSDGTFTWGGTKPTTVSDPFKYGVGPVPPSDPFKYSIGPQAVNVPDSPEWTSWEVPPGMMGDEYQKNLEFFDNLNKGIVENNNTYQLGDNILDSLVNSSQVGNQNVNRLKGSVLEATPKKGIMERISDFFFTPAAAAEIDYSKLPGAKDPFTPKFDFLEKHNQGVKDYKGTTKQDYVDAVTSGAFGKTAGATSWGRNVGDLFEGVNLGKDWSAFDVTPQFISHGQGTGSGYIDIDKDALEEGAIDALPGGFFKAKGGRVGYSNGGLASLFNRRG